MLLKPLENTMGRGLGLSSLFKIKLGYKDSLIPCCDIAIFPTAKSNKGTRKIAISATNLFRS
jgi:hypothetical protein